MHGPGGFGGPRGRGPRGHGPGGYGRYSFGPRHFYFGGSVINEPVELIKKHEYDGKGKKYYIYTLCDCEKIFGLDYRLSDSIEYQSNDVLLFRDGKYINSGAVDGNFIIKSKCLNCSKENSIAVHIREVPSFVRNQLLSKVNRVEYDIVYIFTADKEYRIQFHAYFNTDGITLDVLSSSIDNLFYQGIEIDDCEVQYDLSDLSMYAIKLFEEKTGNKVNLKGDFSIPKSNINLTFNDRYASLFKQYKFVLQHDGLKGVMEYKNKSLAEKEMVKKLVR